MPHIAARRRRPHSLVGARRGDAPQDGLCRRDLVRPHHQQRRLRLRRQHAIARQHAQERLLGEEHPREILQIRDHAVAPIRPERRELEAVAALLPARPPSAALLPDGPPPRRVGIILRVRPVRDDEELHILEKPAPRPETLPLITVDLVERLPQRHPPPLQLDLRHRQAIHQNRHVITRRVRTARLRVLPHHLQAVVVDPPSVQQRHVLETPIVPPQHLHRRTLQPRRLLRNPLVRRRDGPPEETFPLPLRKDDPIQYLQLPPQVRHQRPLIPNRHRLIPLRRQPRHQRVLQFRLALPPLRHTRQRLILRHHRARIALRDQPKLTHARPFLSCTDSAGQRVPSSRISR